jgi:hypothetical protein
MKPKRNGRVRCSAWLGVVALVPPAAIPPLIIIWVCVAVIWVAMVNVWLCMYRARRLLRGHNPGEPENRRRHHCNGHGQDDNPPLEPVGLSRKNCNETGKPGNGASNSRKLTLLNVGRGGIYLFENLWDRIFRTHKDVGVTAPPNEASSATRPARRSE